MEPSSADVVLPMGADTDTDTSTKEEALPPKDETEMTRDEALELFLTDEELCDFTFVGSDGILVPVNRYLLASRSPVFRRMLFGKLKEAHETQAEIGYDSNVLKEIVRYICTNEISELDLSLDWPDGDDDEFQIESQIESQIEMIRFAVTLMSAANYFALPELRRKVGDEIKETVQVHEISTLVFVACAPDCEFSKDLQDEAMAYIRGDEADELINKSKEVLALIHPTRIKNIIKDEFLSLDANICFQIVLSWANAVEQSDNDNESSSRKWLAKQMITDLILLEDIGPKYLSTLVSESELVSKDQLLDAFMKQGIRADKISKIVYKRVRDSPSLWQSTSTRIFRYDGPSCADQIRCPPLTSGIHRWGIKVEDGSYGVELGIASTKWPFKNNDSLGCQRGCWVLNNYGFVEHALDFKEASIEKTLLPRRLSRDGCIFTFTLDLERDGVLTVSIDGKNPIQLFSGLLQGDHGDGDVEGFVPAAAFCLPGGVVEFLGFEEDVVS